MNAKSRQFELLVGRILSLSKEGATNVVHDDRVIDPDGEGRTRQVDITFARSGMVVHVECRDHKSPQDVKWIEELIGRRTSLKPDVMIGVSSSGFTPLALKKAKAYGIFLRSIRSITDEEILSRGRRVDVTVHFVRLECLNFILSSPLRLSDSDFAEFQQNIFDTRLIDSWLSNLALQCNSVGADQTVPLSLTVPIPSHFPLNPTLSKITQLMITCYATGVRQEFRMASALVSTEEITTAENDTVVFDYAESGTELHLSSGTFRWAIDFSRIRYPKNCFFSGEIRLDLGEPQPFDGALILGLDATKALDITAPVMRQL